MRTVLLLLMVLMPFSRTLDAKGVLKTKKDIQRLFNRARGTFALVAEDCSANRAIHIRPHEQFHAASTIKIAVMMEVFRQSAAGAFSLDDSLTVRNEFRSIVDSTLFSLDSSDDGDEELYGLAGKRVTVRELVRRMIIVSSNLATNLLLEFVGPGNVTTMLKSNGINATLVLRGVEDQKAYEAGLNNLTTAYDLMCMLKLINGGTFVSRQASAEMMDILFQQKFRTKIPRYLPASVKVAHKTGSISGVEHDCGIVLLPDGRKYIVVALSKNLRRNRTGELTIARASRRVYDCFSVPARRSLRYPVQTSR